MEDKNLETIQKETGKILLVSNGLVIDNADTLAGGIDFLTRIKTIGENIKEEKDEIIDPFKKAIKNAQSRFKKVETEYADSEKIVKEKIKEYVSGKENYSCEGELGKISVRKLTKVIIVDLESLPSKYLTQTPNEKLIKEDLLNGIYVDGAELKINESIALLKK